MTDIADRGVLTIQRVPLPASLDAPDAGMFLEMVRIANAVCLHEAGHDYLREEPEEVLGFWQDQTDWTQLGFAVVRDGAVLGVVKLLVSNEPEVSTIEFDLMVDPPMWGQGVEQLLLAEVLREARERGLPTVQTWTLHRPSTGGRRLAPSTGWGSIPADDPQTRFWVEAGFTLEQVERNSVFDLTGDFRPVERMLAEAVSFAGSDYRPISWTAPTPAEHREGFAYALSRMSTDAPHTSLL